MIRKKGDQYVILDKDGKKTLGTFDTLEEAQDKEREIRGITKFKPFTKKDKKNGD